jgi:serine acetyltransferase
MPARFLSTPIGRRLCVERRGSIVIHGATVRGDDCLIRHGATTGNMGFEDPYGAPTIGERKGSPNIEIALTNVISR